MENPREETKNEELDNVDAKEQSIKTGSGYLSETEPEVDSIKTGSGSK